MIKTEYIYLSITDYNEVLLFQKKKVDDLKNGDKSNYLIFLEHNDVITRGIRAKNEDLLADISTIMKENILFTDTDRGGSLTAHGPGQLVLYTIFNLKRCGLSVREFIDKIINSFMYWLKTNGITAYYNDRYPGLYVNGKKILSLGLRLDSFITYHGFALNLNSVPKGFKYIIPCSVKNCSMTSVYLETSVKYDIRDVSVSLYNIIRERF
ncbi:MAG: lipoyl(octanoyl) transferase LipB [Deltaproteobacteria bacterium]|nr:lipoyl(octanoyl) transferase LipB [Deltaproteobacteria bacterium]